MIGERDESKDHDNEGGDRHIKYMKLAIEQATTALRNGEVPVGCVFVHFPMNGEERVIGTGFNQTNISRNGTKHAEIVAIDNIIFDNDYSADIFQECDLYVTCEPCIMCAAAIGKLGIRSVYYGCRNDRFGGNGSILSLHENCPGCSPYQVHSDIMKDESIALFQKFYAGINLRAPEEKRKRRRTKVEDNEEDEKGNGSGNTHS